MLALTPLASGCAGTGSDPAPGTGAAAPAHAPGTGVATPARAPRAVLRAGPARAIAAQADRLSPAQARRAAARRRGPAEEPLTLPAPPAGNPAVKAREGYAGARLEDYL
ncbi:hypothetical protein ACN6K9_004265 [Streptomyces sp. SAS_267]|uniref:hypothetical protein n=1 Tax=Streptomyces sp. SAS_267 TaxID=3412750 RepID=UPI00403C0B4A